MSNKKDEFVGACDRLRRRVDAVGCLLLSLGMSVVPLALVIAFLAGTIAGAYEGGNWICSRLASKATWIGLEASK